MKEPASSPTLHENGGHVGRVSAWIATYGIFFFLICVAIYFHREMNFYGGEARDRALWIIGIFSSLVLGGTAFAWISLLRRPPAERAEVIIRCKLGIRLAYMAFILNLVGGVAAERNLPEVNLAISILLFIPAFPLSCILATFSVGDANQLPEICLGLFGGAAYFYLIGIYFHSVRRRFRSHRQQRLTGRYCEVCGYNLRGIVSGVCPECGTPRPAPTEPPMQPLNPKSSEI